MSTPLSDRLAQLALDASRLAKSPGAGEPEVILHRLLEHLPQAAVVTNDDGRYVYANPAAAALLGYEQREIGGLSIGAFSPRVSEREVERLWSALHETQSQTGRYQLLVKNGTIVSAEYAIRANVLAGLHVSFLRRMP